MKRILLTGATGRVGANLIPKLLENGCAVRAFLMKDDPQRAKLKDFDVEIVEGSLLDRTDVEKAIKGCDALLHLAAIMILGSMEERAFWDVNVTGTFELIRSAVHNRLERILLASTDATYTAWNPVYTPIDENHPQRPFFLYGLTKKACEDILFSAWLETKTPVVAMRFSNVKCCDEILNAFTVGSLYSRLSGYASHPGSGVYLESRPHAEEQISDLMSNPDRLVIPLSPDFRSWREHLVDVRDLIQGISLCLTCDEAVGEAINLAAPEAASWEAGVKYISEKTGAPCTERIIDNFWSYDVSIEKARRLLGYNPQYGLKRMIDDALLFREGKDLGLIPPVIS